MGRMFNNANEQTQRNEQIYKERSDGALVVDLAAKYNLSIPRIHRIFMQEENKALKKEVKELKSKCKVPT